MSLLRFLPIAVCLLPLVTACDGHMLVPQDVSHGLDELRVSDRFNGSGLFIDESFKLGRYAVDDVSRGIIPADRYSFTFKGVHEARKAKCDLSDLSSHFKVGGFTIGQSGTLVSCVCAASDSAKLELYWGDSGASGTLQVQGETYTLAPIYEREGAFLSKPGPSGYRVDSAQPVAAVDVLHPGKVWLTKTLATPDEREGFACLLAGLLLFRPRTD
jgi:hypothetical protein